MLHRALPYLTLLLAFQCQIALGDSVPELVNYQGKLTNASGAPLANGEYTVEFRLFDAKTQGTLVWGEERLVTVVDGVFNIALGGGGSPIDGAAVNNLSFAFGGADRFLEIKIVSGPSGAIGQVLFPRQQLVSTPYAMTAFNGVPPGTVLPFFGTTAPEGWLICAGQPLARVGDYAQLFAVIGTSCGAPDSGSFNIPDLRGRFLRGADDPDGDDSIFASANRDPDVGSRSEMAEGSTSSGGVGSIQDDSFKNHSHPGSTFASADHKHWTSFGADGGNVYSGNDRFGTRVVVTAGQHITTVSFGTGPRRESSTDVPTATASVISEGSSETRPINAACNYIIKY